jgi:hypothetical protein
MLCVLYLRGKIVYIWLSPPSHPTGLCRGVSLPPLGLCKSPVSHAVPKTLGNGPGYWSILVVMWSPKPGSVVLGWKNLAPCLLYVTDIAVLFGVLAPTSASFPLSVDQPTLSYLSLVWKEDFPPGAPSLVRTCVVTRSPILIRMVCFVYSLRPPFWNSLLNLFLVNWFLFLTDTQDRMVIRINRIPCNV